MRKVANIMTTGSMVMFLVLLNFWLFNTQSIFFPFVVFLTLAYIISAVVYNVVESYINRKGAQK